MIRFKMIACVGVALMALSARAEDPKLPADLAAVPGDAIVFVHVRAADLWKIDALKDFRAMIEKAGSKALNAFDERFVPAPSTIDRVTIFAIGPADAGPEPPFVGVVACNKPFDRAKLLKSLLPQGKEIKVGNATIHADEEFNLAIRVIDDRTFALAMVGVMRRYLETPPAKSRPLAPALRLAAERHHLTIGLNVSSIPNEAIAELPPALQPLGRAKLAYLAMDVGGELSLDLRADFADAAQAKAGEGAAQEGLAMAREALKGAKAEFARRIQGKDTKSPAAISELPEAALSVLALGGIETFDELLKTLPLKRDGTSVAVSVKLPLGPYVTVLGMAGMSAGLALPAVRRARMASTRTRSANNLKQILLACHSYHDRYNGFPPAAICDKNGKPILSWRVAILPFIEQEALYKQFHLDEPWDSEHNKKLIAMMPKTYRLPDQIKQGETDTHYRVFYGGGAAFELKKSVRFSDFTDGTSNTIMVVEAAEGVPWTKPAEFELDPKKPLPKLGKISAEGFWAAMADGSVRYFSHNSKETTIRALLTRNGGEIVNPDE